MRRVMGMMVGKKLPEKRHTVEKITFVPRTNDGPMECSCGWAGQASAFSEHRAGFGLKKPTYPTAAKGFEQPSAFSIKPTCSVMRCVGKPVGRGFCTTHYKRWQRGQDMEPPVIPHPKSAVKSYA